MPADLPPCGRPLGFVIYHATRAETKVPSGVGPIFGPQVSDYYFAMTTSGSIGSSQQRAPIYRALDTDALYQSGVIMPHCPG